MNNMNNENSQGQQQNTSGASGNEQKTFTQEDVNRIVQDRLAKEKQKGQEDITAKQKELAAKELRLDSIALLREKELPDELADIIGASNIKEFGEKADKLKSLMNSTKAADEEELHVVKRGALIGSVGKAGYIDPVRKAFGL